MEKVGDRVRQRREQLNMTQYELGVAVGMTQQGIATIEDTEEKPDQKRKPTKRPRMINEIARALGVRVNWLLYAELPMDFTAGDEEQPARGEDPMIPVIGEIQTGGLVDFSRPGELGSVPVPPGDEDWKALAIGKNAGPPAYKDGHVLYYTSARFSPEQVVNNECVVSTSGQIYVRHVLRGADANRWHLSAPNAEPLLNQPVEWASPIVWVKKWDTVTG